jgi:predicted kinase
MTYLGVGNLEDPTVDDEQVSASELMMTVRRQDKRRAKVAGTHVIADGNFRRRASRRCLLVMIKSCAIVDKMY